MATITTRPVTAEEFAAIVERPENAGRFFELDEGEIIELPPPQKPHGFASANLVFLLSLYCRERGRGYVLTNDTGVVLERNPDTVRGPDVMLCDDDATADEILSDDSWLETPPVLAVEVLSPSNRYGQISRKVNQYLTAGVQLVWVVDPPAREVTVYRPGDSPSVSNVESKLTGGDALPGLAIKVAELFRMPGEK